MTARRTFFLWIVLHCVAACGGDLAPGGSSEASEPSPPSLFSTPGDALPGSAAGPAALVSDLTAVDTLGARRTPPEEVFGEIVDADFGPRERLYLLDRARQTIHVFGPSGEFVSKVGRAGAGPGEFAEPEALEAGPDGRVFVADGDGRVSTFRVGEDSLQHERTFVPGVRPRDLCVSDGQLFVHSPDREGTIHALDRSGRPERSFGRPAEASHSIVRLTLSVSRIACSVPDDVVAELPRFRPLLRIHRGDGSLIRVDTLPGYQPIRVRETTPRRALFDWTTAEGTHRAISLLADGSGRLIVQLGFQDTSRVAPSDHQAVVTHRYELETGTHLDAGTGAPWLLALEDGRAAGLIPLPYPRVVLYRRGEGLDQGAPGRRRGSTPGPTTERLDGTGGSRGCGS